MSAHLSPTRRWSSERPKVVDAVCSAFPDAEAIYRFGSWGTIHESEESDLDLAVLLPWQQASQVDLWHWAGLGGEVGAIAQNDKVDLINLREVDVLFQFEILRTGEVIYCAHKEARLNFEVLTVSKYQELMSWRKGLEEAALSGELYSPRP